MLEITIHAEGETPRQHRFEGQRLTIGRDRDNDLVLDSMGCSRHHAEIVREGAGFRLRDLGSTNGVLFGTQVVRDLPLADGIEVVIGQHRLSFALPDQEAPEATVRLHYGSLQAADPTAPRSEGSAPAAPARRGFAPPAPVPRAPAPSATAPSPPVAPWSGATPAGAPRPAVTPAAEPAPPAGPKPLYLIFGSGSQERNLKIVPGTEYILGRSPSADLVLEDRESSKRHALIYARGERFYAVDLQSSNGTFVNGERIRDVPLSPGDEITIGQTRIRVEEQILDLIDRANLLERTRLGSAWRGGERPAERGEVGPREAGPRTGGRGKAGYLVAALAVAAVLAAGYLLGSRRQEAPAAAGTAPGEVRTPGGGTPTAPRLVQVAPARLRELVVDLSGSGSVEAQRSVTVSAEVAARVVELLVEQGDPVERGELLLRLDDRDIRHRIEAARASVSSEQLSLARQDYQRKERLFEDGAVVRSVYEQAKSQYLTLEAAYRSTQATISGLEEQLAKTRLSAPIAGVVTRIVVAAGEVVAPGSPLLILENTERMLVRLELADRDFVKVRLGQPAEATAAAFPGRVFRGEVSRLGSAADPVTRTFEVEARLYNPDRVLRPGLIVTLRIVLGREPGLVVPAEAVVEEHNGRGEVFAVRGGVARRLEVGLGRRFDREVQVTEGLSEGDEVVVVGHQDLVDGQAVEPYREPGGAGTAGS